MQLLLKRRLISSLLKSSFITSVRDVDSIPFLVVVKFLALPDRLLLLVPFVLAEIGQTPSSDYVGVLDEEKVLSLGKEISAVGIPSLENGIPQIKSCQDLPCFLSEMTKDQMVVDLAYKTNFLYWGSLLLGSFSLGILGYAIMRNWGRWWQRRQSQRSGDARVATEYQSDEETGEIPDEESCVICLTRRRRFAFLPCGHLVCCQGCPYLVEQLSEPRCPVCRLAITTSHRIYGS
ncbi:zinc finger protein [Macleaya cordata]|uniref:RING-type E3 ubiquitin transferase n=1 Tax=Macleaya cordata TaxID=56857 RepID=A0A200QNG1_MACCD|nr:zinc finger protein [Macleaya cordata]